MKKKVLVSSIACLTIMVLAFAIASAQGMRRPACDNKGPMMGIGGFHKGDMVKHRNPYHMLKVHADEIGLTDDQLKFLEKKSIDTEKATIKLKSKIDTLRVDMRAEMDQDKPNRTVVFKLLDEMNSLQGELKKTRISYLLDIKDILTPDQQSKARELREKKRGDMMKMHQQRRFHGNPEPEEF